MKFIKFPTEETWETVLSRPQMETKAIRDIVKPILKKVKSHGEKALRKFILEYDHVKLDHLFVTKPEFINARNEISRDLKKAIHVAYDHIEKFHHLQLPKTIKISTTRGVECSRKALPIDRVGLYVPGGTAPLFSTVLMLGIPAKIAGCPSAMICSPCNRNGQINPAILYSAELTGIREIAKIGGAQAIAAMAYGTESIQKVFKIFGPGNQYVTMAKQIVSKQGVAIDMPAGPSELMVIADNSANPAYVAADLLSQAEHGIDSQVILVSNSVSLIEKVKKEIETQKDLLPRKHIISKSLQHSLLIQVRHMEQAVKISNFYAPEHLIIATRDHDHLAGKIRNAGSVFLGNFTPETAGDYASGTNHTLPTYGFARAYSGLSVENFMKTITFQKISRSGLKNIGEILEIMAGAEELHAHKNAVRIRLDEIK